jgi:hypothetical protein
MRILVPMFMREIWRSCRVNASAVFLQLFTIATKLQQSGPPRNLPANRNA